MIFYSIVLKIDDQTSWFDFGEFAGNFTDDFSPTCLTILDEVKREYFDQLDRVQYQMTRDYKDKFVELVIAKYKVKPLEVVRLDGDFAP